MSNSAKFTPSYNHIEYYKSLLGGGGVLQVGYQIITLLLLLDTSKDHLGSGNILFGVDKVFVESIFSPSNT